MPPPHHHPRSLAPDTPLAAALRFALEVGAWVAIQKVWGWLALVVAVLLLSLLNARGDKNFSGIPVPGPLRILVEVGVLALGSWAAARWLGPLAGGLMLGALLLLLLVGRARYRWLLGR